MKSDEQVIEFSNYFSSRARDGECLLEGFQRIRPEIRDVRMPNGSTVTVDQMRRAARDIIEQSDEEPIFSTLG